MDPLLDLGMADPMGLDGGYWNQRHPEKYMLASMGLKVKMRQ
jgi:hypothetical protein